jgi:hypothetical protein
MGGADFWTGKAVYRNCMGGADFWTPNDETICLSSIWGEWKV